MNEVEIKINKIAQGILPIEEGMDWFESASEETVSEILGALDYFILQAHPTTEDIERAIKLSGLKETYSPCVLVRKKHLNEVRAKVLKMQGIDRLRSFRLFIYILGVADGRRRVQQCVGGCTHDWHNL